jgi:hypothetical protein
MTTLMLMSRWAVLVKDPVVSTLTLLLLVVLTLFVVAKRARSRWARRSVVTMIWTWMMMRLLQSVRTSAPRAPVVVVLVPPRPLVSPMVGLKSVSAPAVAVVAEVVVAVIVALVVVAAAVVIAAASVAEVAVAVVIAVASEVVVEAVAVIVAASVAEVVAVEAIVVALEVAVEAAAVTAVASVAEVVVDVARDAKCYVFPFSLQIRSMEVGNNEKLSIGMRSLSGLLN